MASSKRKKHGAGYVVLIAVLILVLLAVVAAVTGYSLVARRVKALQAGAAFTFDYEITSTADSPALYTILQKTGSTKGTVNGLYAPDALQLSISAPDAVIPAGPLTRVYISSSETLYDVGQLYKNIRSSITGSYPLASLLLPDWSLGSYISQAQLASLLGVDTTATSLQDMTEFELPQKKLQRVQPENAKDGYLYFQLDTGDASANAPVLVIGLEKSRFFADAIPVHILLTIPEHGVSIQLTGTVSAQTVVLTAPTSRMKDEDIQTLVQIRDTIQSVLQFVQTAANSVQNAGRSFRKHQKPETAAVVSGFCSVILPVEDAAIGGEGDYIPRDELAAVLQSSDGSMLQPAAAGHLHAQHGHALDIIAADDLGQLFAVIHSIQLRAADDGHMAPHELLVDIGVGIGGAVGGDQQLGTVKVGRVHRHQLDLARPLCQLGLHGHCGCGRCGLLTVKLFHHAARAAMERRCGGLCLLLGGSGLFLLVFQHSLLVISGGFALGKGDSTGGASGQAVAKAVAVVVPHQLGLAVHKADGTLVAGGDAGTAAVAFFFVYMNDFADHGKILLALMF